MTSLPKPAARHTGWLPMSEQPARVWSSAQPDGMGHTSPTTHELPPRTPRALPTTTTTPTPAPQALRGQRLGRLWPRAGGRAAPRGGGGSSAAPSRARPAAAPISPGRGEGGAPPAARPLLPEAGRNDPRSPATPPPVPSKVYCSSGDFLCRPRGRLGSPGAGRGAVGGCSGSQARLEALPPRVPARAGPPRPPAAAAAAASACRSRECQVNNESVIYFLWCPDGRGNGGPRGGGGGRGGARIRGTTRAGKPAFVGGPVISPPPAPSPPLVWPLLQLLGWRELRGLGSQVVRPRGDDLP